MKEKLKKIRNLLFLCFVLVTAGILFQAQDAQAAKIGSYKLSDSKPTKKYDVTGDGKADKIEIKKLNKSKEWGDSYSYQGFKVLVNGKTILKNNEIFDYYRLDIFLIKTKTYSYFKIDRWDCGDMGATENIYKYSKNQLKKCISLRNIEKKYEGWIFHYKISSVKAHSIKIKIEGQTGMLGETKSSFELKVGKGGKLSLAKKVVGVSCKIWLDDHLVTPKYLITTKKIQVYKNEGTTKKAFSIKKGSKVKITKVSIRKKKPTYYCITKSGKKGWIKTGFKLFENLAYAG